MENISLDNVKLLIDEMDYYNDIKEENEEKLVTVNEEVQIFVNLYNEFNRKSNQNKADLKIFQKELEEINEKQARLDGKISKKNSDRKKYLEEKIESLKSEIVIAQENKKEARISYNDIMKNNPNLEISQNISKLNDEIEIKKQKISAIYQYCISKINEIENKIKTQKQNIVNAVNNQDYDLLESLSIELSELIREKNNSIFKYKEIINFLNNSSYNEKQAFVDKKDEISEINNLENNIIEETNNIINNDIDNLEEKKDSEAENLKSKNNYKTAIVKKANNEENIEILDNSSQVVEEENDETNFVEEENKNDDKEFFAIKTDGLVSTYDYDNIIHNSNDVSISEEELNDLAEKSKIEETNLENNEKSKFNFSVIGKIKNISKIDLKSVLREKINQGKLLIQAGLKELLDDDLDDDLEENQNIGKGRL